jgi:hypothetical protein
MFAFGAQGEVVAQKLTVSLPVVEQVKNWVRQALPENMRETALLLQEVRCFEPGCAPIETFIAVLEEPQRFQTKILLPMIDVVQSDVVAAMPAKLAWESGEKLMAGGLHKTAIQVGSNGAKSEWPEASWRIAKHAQASNGGLPEVPGKAPSVVKGSAENQTPQVQEQEQEQELLGEDGWPLPAWRAKKHREQHKNNPDGALGKELSQQASQTSAMPAVHWLHAGLQGCPCCAPMG